MFRSKGWIGLILVLILFASMVYFGRGLSFLKTPAPRVTQTQPGVVQADFSGRVIDINGVPINGAVVSTPNHETKSDPRGWFELPAVGSSQWITVQVKGYISRTRAAEPGVPVLFRLSPDDGHTIVITFGGDTMFGRRFFDPNEDGDVSDGLLPVQPTEADQRKLLAPVQPVLQNADLTVLNFESPLADPAYFSPRDPRPVAFHTTKDYVFASDPSSVKALKQAGVDLLDIGNNHIYDILEDGVKNTLASLDQNQIAHFGAGTDETTAWAPAITEVKGQKIAFIGCTTIWRPEPQVTDHDTSYTASDLLQKGGAAFCQTDNLRETIRQAKEAADLVVVMIHGGNEYKRTPSENVAKFTQIAKEAGATLVINHHPHVVSGFQVDNQALTAWSLGNFIFDQTVWPTFEANLLSVYIRDGKVVRAIVEPFMVEDYVSHGVTGQLADGVVRGAAGWMQGPFIMENRAMEIDFDHRATKTISTQVVNGGAGPGLILALPQEKWISGFTGSGSLRLGRDLLWVGGFERQEVGGPSQGAPLWDLGSKNAQFGQSFAYAGQAGVRLTAGNKNGEDVVTSPIHRILVTGGSRLSVTGMMRVSSGAAPVIQLSWYPDTKGPSSTLDAEPLSIQAMDTWQPFRFDVQVPQDAVAVGLYLRLPPPAMGIATVDFDDLHLIQWADSGAAFSPLYNFAQVTGQGEVTFTQQLLPGAAAWSQYP